MKNLGWFQSILTFSEHLYLVDTHCVFSGPVCRKLLNLSYGKCFSPLSNERRPSFTVPVGKVLARRGFGWKSTCISASLRALVASKLLSSIQLAYHSVGNVFVFWPSSVKIRCFASNFSSGYWVFELSIGESSWVFVSQTEY